MPFPDRCPAGPDSIERSWRTWAAADLILCDEAWLRVYSFDPNWAEGQRFGKIDTGGGDTISGLFTPEGTVLKGFDHESEVSRHARDDGEPWPGLYDGMPEPLLEALDNPALEPEDVTFCLWRGRNDPHWWRGLALPPDLDDGSDVLFDYLTDQPETYLEWAEDYYERSIDGEALALLAGGAVVTSELIVRLNPERDAAAALAELLDSGLIDPETHCLRSAPT